METLEMIKEIRDCLEGYEGIEYEYKFFGCCTTRLENLTRKIDQLIEVGMHTTCSKEKLRSEYNELKEKYNKLYEDLKPYMNASYDGYKTYCEQYHMRYSNVIDYRHSEDYYLNQMANEVFNN